MLNGTTGEITTASEYTTLPGKDRQGNDVPASVQQLKANSILKFKVGVKDTAESAAPVTLTPTALQFAGYPMVTGVKADESKPTDPKSEDAKKDNSSTPAPSQSADSATDAKDTAKSDAKTDSKSDSRDELNPSKDGVKADLSGSSQAQREGGSSKGALASTGANGVAGLLAVGSVALLGGAAILVRRRKA